MDLVFPLPDSRPRLSPVHYVRELDQYLSIAHEAARNHDCSHRRIQKTWYDQKVHGNCFPVGCYVWVLNTAISPGTSKAFHIPWKGPYKVVSSSPPVYTLESTSGPCTQLRVHFNRLKACRSKVPAEPQPVVTPDPPMPSASYDPWPADDGLPPMQVIPPPPPAPPPPPLPVRRPSRMPSRFSGYHVPPRSQW